jgi:agmatinase
MQWMNLPEEYRTGKFALLPIAYEGNVSYGEGASSGCKEIINASQQLEYYDCELECEPFLQGIEVLDSVTARTPEDMIEKVSSAIKENKEKFIMSLGGDHSITIGCVKGMEEMYDDFSVITFDAHPDMFHSWNGSQYNHRCTGQRISEKHELCLIGIRSMDKDEHGIIKSNENIHVVKAREFSVESIKEIVPKLKDKVYISIDVDVFDPSFIRNTGTPEPGGLQWQEVIATLQLIFSEKEVIGADIVEFAPVENFRAEAYSLAKLVYKIIAMKKIMDVQYAKKSSSVA